MAGKDLHEKDLRKLGKVELLELLVEQSRENLVLKERLAKAEAELEARRIQIEQSGSIAEAALKLSGVFEAAQKAIDLYRENCERQYEEMLTRAEGRSEDATEAAENGGKEDTE